jgi:hypothetical protein
MRNEFTKYVVDWGSVTSGASLALRFRCAETAPFIQMDRTKFKET